MLRKHGVSDSDVSGGDDGEGSPALLYRQSPVFCFQNHCFGGGIMHTAPFLPSSAVMLVRDGERLPGCCKWEGWHIA